MAAKDQDERRRTRVSCKIERLPPEIKRQVDDMLSDNSNTFTYISDWLKEQEFDISRGAVGRYSVRMGKAAQRLAESIEKTKLILDRIERNPEIDISKAAQAVLADGLMQRMSTADSEIFEMPLEKAGRLLTAMRRVDVAERKLTFEMRKKIDLAFAEMESQIMSVIKNDPILSAQLHEVLIKTKEKMVADE